jgi:hypothetical protein
MLVARLGRGAQQHPHHLGRAGRDRRERRTDHHLIGVGERVRPAHALRPGEGAQLHLHGLRIGIGDPHQRRPSGAGQMEVDRIDGDRLRHGPGRTGRPEPQHGHRRGSMPWLRHRISR